jgi:hypothetical protein
MNKSKFLKGFALINFTVLITLFLLYSNGSFDDFQINDNKLSSPNGGTLTSAKKDTGNAKMDSAQKQKISLSSSKSVVLIDNIKFKKDTFKTIPDSNHPQLEKVIYMHGSKSGRIFEPPKVVPQTRKQKRQQKKAEKRK